VSIAREYQLWQGSPLNLDGAALARLILDYRKKVKADPKSTFLDPKANQLNFDPATRISESRLIQVVDVTRMHDSALKLGSKRKIPEFVGYPDDVGVDHPRVQQWLEEELQGSESNAVLFVDALLKLMNEMRGGFNPAWVSPENDFRRFINGGADRWAEAFGITPSAQPNHWLIVLAYPMREAGTLVRPTMLESGWNCSHFPSPPPSVTQTKPALPQDTGFCMDLDCASGATDLVSEMVHENIELKVEYFEALSCLRGRTTDRDIHYVDKQRRAHHNVLSTSFDTAGVNEWMPAPV
jgi:hypothetical protein